MSFSPKELKKLVGHYGKHVYDEGRVFKHVPVGPDNVDQGQGVDEYGRTYRCGASLNLALCLLISRTPGTSAITRLAGKA